MTISQLQPGERFRFPYNGRIAVLVRLGDSGAVVRPEGKRREHIRVIRGGEVVQEVEFDKPKKALVISLGTEVERVTHEEGLCRSCS